MPHLYSVIRRAADLPDLFIRSCSSSRRFWQYSIVTAVPVDGGAGFDDLWRTGDFATAIRLPAKFRLADDAIIVRLFFPSNRWALPLETMEFLSTCTAR